MFKLHSIFLPLLLIAGVPLANAADLSRPPVGIHDGRPAMPPVPPINAEITVTTTIAGVEKVQAGHYYRSRDGKIREDMGPISVIIDPGAGVITSLNRQLKEKSIRQIERPARPAVARQVPRSADRPVAGGGYKASQSSAGSFEGHPIQKLTISPPPGSNARLQGVEVWMAPDIRLQVFSESKGPDHTTRRAFSKITVTDPDPGIFAVPADYNLVNEKIPISPN